MTDRWPAAMPFDVAAEYLGYSNRAIIDTLIKEGKLIPLNLSDKPCDRRIAKVNLDRLIEQRLLERGA